MKTNFKYITIKNEEFDIIEKKYKNTYSRYAEFKVVATTEEACEKMLRAFRDYIENVTSYSMWECGDKPEQDSEGNWIGCENIVLEKDFFDTIKEEFEYFKEEYKNFLESEKEEIVIQNQGGCLSQEKPKKKVKKIGGAIYIHRSNVDVLSQEELDLVWDRLSALGRSEYAPALGTYEIIKIKDSSVSFIDCPDWDEADEPTVGNAYRVDSNDNVHLTPMKKDNPQIYHHKYMFVADNYEGFNVAEAKAWSKKWQSVIPAGHGKYYGYKNYWENLLIEFGLKTTIRTKEELKNLIANAKKIEATVVREKGSIVIELVANRLDENYLELTSSKMKTMHNTTTLTNLIADHINDGYLNEIVVDNKKITFGNQ